MTQSLTYRVYWRHSVLDYRVILRRHMIGQYPDQHLWYPNLFLRILQLEEENKQMEDEWNMKLQKIRSQTEMTVQQLQQQLVIQEEEVQYGVLCVLYHEQLSKLSGPSTFGIGFDTAFQRQSTVWGGSSTNPHLNWLIQIIACPQGLSFSQLFSVVRTLIDGHKLHIHTYIRTNWPT